MIAACMKEIKALPNIMAEDYKAFVSYKMCVVNNHTRLSAAGIEHQVFNPDTMQKLVSKLPWRQVEKWSKYLEEQDKETKARPIELF